MLDTTLKRFCFAGETCLPDSGVTEGSLDRTSQFGPPHPLKPNNSTSTVQQEALWPIPIERCCSGTQVFLWFVRLEKFRILADPTAPANWFHLSKCNCASAAMELIRHLCPKRLLQSYGVSLRFSLFRFVPQYVSKHRTSDRNHAFRQRFAILMYTPLAFSRTHRCERYGQPKVYASCAMMRSRYYYSVPLIDGRGSRIG